jgi:hypothetical protein
MHQFVISHDSSTAFFDYTRNKSDLTIPWLSNHELLLHLIFTGRRLELPRVVVQFFVVGHGCFNKKIKKNGIWS